MAKKYTVEKILAIKKWTDFLFSFRTSRSKEFLFIPGQFARLGLRIKAHDDESIIWRPYSVVSSAQDDQLEFYSIIVPNGEFTQKLATLGVNDEILVDAASYGQLTLDRFSNGKHLWLLATGTGLGPFISILYETAVWQQYAKVIVVHCARNKEELAYQDVINGFHSNPHYQQLVKDKLIYVRMLTRDKTGADLYLRITDAIKDHTLEQHLALPITATDSRIMLCGNPAMVNEVRKILGERGLSLSKRSAPGSIAVENYW